MENRLKQSAHLFLEPNIKKFQILVSNPVTMIRKVMCGSLRNVKRNAKIFIQR